MKTGPVQATFMGAILGLAAGATADTVRMTSGPFTAGAGGEFTATVESGYGGETGPGGSFQTFCLERNAPINLGGGISGNANLFDFTLSAAAHSGGVGGGSPDPISAGTAYLFTMFRNGTLSNYSFNGTAAERRADADSLQIALWTLEDEYTGQPPANAQATAWLAEAAAAVANGSIWGDTIGDVRVLSLWQGGNDFQDMLTIIPLPPSVWMGLASLAGIGVLQIRRRARAMTPLA
ncbi:MAG: hypothetical protein IT437_10020 [Phycisphaerales bacterium]|nr:hypothetical protein [Phycisphaerales bacterium]